jgi:hypothetical protein
MNFSHVIFAAFVHLLKAAALYGIYISSRAETSKSSTSKWLQYTKAAGCSLLLALFFFANNDGTLKECDDRSGEMSCYTVEGYEIDPQERKESSAILFLVVFVAAACGIKDAHNRKLIAEKKRKELIDKILGPEEKT